MTHRYTLQDVARRYRESHTGRTIDALRVPHLEVASGEILAVVGENGSGKSTLLETMAFLHPPDEGRILLDGRDVWAAGASLAARRRCPILLQKTLLFRTTVLGNVMYGLRARGMGRAEARRRAEAVLRVAGLGALAHRRHRELSGGERQRVALARLLVLEPEILLLDEPTAQVDQANQQVIEAIIRDLCARSGMTVVLATHDPAQAATLATRTITLLAGQCVTASQCAAASQKQCYRDAEISIDPSLVHILSPVETPAADLHGRIEGVWQQGDRCRLEVRLSAGPTLRAEIARADYDRLGLNLGVCVRLEPPPLTVGVVQSRAPGWNSV